MRCVLMCVFVVAAVLLGATSGAKGRGAARADAGSGAVTTVSLEFDDGWADAYAARSLLAARGLHATFFVMSGFVGRPGRLSLGQLRGLGADGNEIGGHTIDHVHLVGLSRQDQERQICNDRAALLGDGFPVKSFSYPYGQHDLPTEAIVADCGYNSGRGLGGSGCSGCPAAESVPPADVYATRTSSGVTSSTTLTTLEGDVTRAEQDHGGWVQIVFHHVCECSELYAITPTRLRQFLDWLTARPSSTQVKTVGQVIGGPLRSPVSGPSANLLLDPGLETDGNTDGVPDCWTPAGYGANTSTWSRTTAAHSGRFAERLVISSWASGDRKLIQPLNSSGCAPTVDPGSVYQAGEWYQSTDRVRLVVYTRESTGTWTFWKTSPYFPPSPGWAEARWTLPPIPEGISAISVGLALSNSGTATFDDAHLVQAG